MRGGRGAAGAEGQPGEGRLLTPPGGGAGTPGHPLGQNPLWGSGGGSDSFGAGGEPSGVVCGARSAGLGCPCPGEGLRGFSHRWLSRYRAGRRSAAALSPFPAGTCPSPAGAGLPCSASGVTPGVARGLLMPLFLVLPCRRWCGAGPSMGTLARRI